MPRCAFLAHWMLSVRPGSLQERANGPIAVRRAAHTVTDEHGVLTSMFWMQARTGETDAYKTPYQKVGIFRLCQGSYLTEDCQCILAYMSDLNLYGF